MAKIYETETDLIRDKITKEYDRVTDSKNSNKFLAAFFAIASAGSFAIALINKKAPADSRGINNEEIKNLKDGLSAFAGGFTEGLKNIYNMSGNVFAVLSASSLTNMFMDKSREKKLADKLEEIGQEQIKYPDGSVSKAYAEIKFKEDFVVSEQVRRKETEANANYIIK